MKQYTSVFSILFVLLAVYVSLTSTWPATGPTETAESGAFSTERARKHVEQMSKYPHAVGFPAHSRVRQYLITELQEMGLQPLLQEGYTAGDWANLSKAINVIARVKGSGDGKALMLLSHYDSNPHSSFGASDAASGVATILEGLRAFLSQNPSPKNDIIVMFSDAEELGLNGADLFVNQHPWAADVGLVLNFEARGSGGPAFMLIETNRGNSRLIQDFKAANPRFPVANSLAYSVYKMLPNDTDLTVFREDRDIEGFNFAFIDDHFDYHTALDTHDRLDTGSLAHQGSYLMPLLGHFSKADLGNLKSLEDDVYFNVPYFGMITYPYEWIWPMFGIASLLFLLLLVYGRRRGILKWKSMAKGFVAALMVLCVNGLIGYFSWPLILKIYPRYHEMLQGFTYNGHSYIAALVFLSLAVCFWGYRWLRKEPTGNLIAGAIVLWLCLCGALAAYLPGASFFIMPVFALLAAFLVVLQQEEPNPYVLLLLSLPAIFIHAPLIQMFPVGLGLKMLITATLLTTLSFLLVLPVTRLIRIRWGIGGLFFLLFVGFMTAAHLRSGFGPDTPRPSSLLYLFDADTREAQWVTYDRTLSAWTSQFILETKGEEKPLPQMALSSKYGTGFSYSSAAPLKAIDAPIVVTVQDTVYGETREVKLRVLPQRMVNRLEIYTNQILIEKARVNGVDLSPFFLSGRKGPRLLTHYISDNSPTELELRFPADKPLELTLYEASNNLLDHPLFSVPPRPESEIPKPFVLNDAILVKKSIRF